VNVATKPATRPSEGQLARMRHGLVVLNDQIPKLQALHERDRMMLNANTDQIVWQTLVASLQSVDTVQLPDHRQVESLAFRIASYIRVRDKITTELARWDAVPGATP
jgi:hypothetical protein